MAVSTIAGDYGGGFPITCILDEGAPTVVSRTYDSVGTYGPGTTFAAELQKGDLVSISSETSNTYEACGGLPVVEAVSNGDDKVCGIIWDEPRLVQMAPNTAAGNTLTKRLAGKYYRIATVMLFNVIAVNSVTLTTANTAAIVPGVVGTLKVDVSECLANHSPCVVDVANGGTGIFSFHYQAQATGAVVTLLAGYTGALLAAID